MSRKIPFGPSPTCDSSLIRTYHQYSWKRTYQNLGSEPSMTKQEFADECDINQILQRYQRTGAITHFSQYAPIYGDYSPCDYQEALNLVKTADKMFADLPSSIRQLTSTPDGFLAFIQDPKNASRLVELGLVEAPPEAVKPPPASPAGT